MDLEEQYDRLLKYCFAKVNDRETAEDLVQETFLRFWQAGSYRDTGKETAYLYTIARNLCFDHFKKRKELPAEDESLFEALPDEHTDVERTVTDRMLIRRALASLPPADREAAVLFFVSDVRVTDIAKILGISRFAVRRKIKAAKEILKKELEGYR